MSNINKTWFYIIDEKFLNEIHIEKDIYVSLFMKNINDDIIINIGENSKVDFYWFFSDVCPKNIIIHQSNNNSSLKFKSLFITNGKDLISNIISHIDSNNSKALLNIIWIVKENKIWINSSIKIEKKSKNIEAKLDLENIFIGTEWNISSTPNLFIDSNDVKVSHSSKSHRVDWSKLFYLQSRGLNEKDSISIIIESYFTKNFSCIEMMDENIFKNILQEFWISLHT